MKNLEEIIKEALEKGISPECLIEYLEALKEI